MDSVDLTDTRVSIEGAAVDTVNELPSPGHAEMSIGGAVVVIKSEGVYRFDTDEAAGPQLRVFRGQADVQAEGERAWKTVRHGQVIYPRCLRRDFSSG